MDTDKFDTIVRDVVTSKPEGYRYTDDPKTIRTRQTEGRQAGDGSCFYRHYDGTPGCIVGAVVAAVNPDIRLQEGAPANNAISQQEKLADVFTDDQIDILTRMQAQQDTGRSWYEAYAKAYDKDPFGKPVKRSWEL